MSQVRLGEVVKLNATVPCCLVNTASLSVLKTWSVIHCVSSKLI